MKKPKKMHKRSVYFKNEDLWSKIDAIANDQQRSTNNMLEIIAGDYVAKKVTQKQ